MKNQVLRTTLLTALILTPAVGMEVLGDAELEEIDAKGLLITVNGGNVNAHQDNNNGSVQLHGNTCMNCNGVSIENVADSASNSATNLLNVGSGGTVTANQYNDQCSGGGAQNTVVRLQEEVENNGDVNDVQDNNNASVQLTDNVQRNAQHFSLINGASSAINRSTNMATISAAGQIDGSQAASQEAKNELAMSDIDTPDPSTITGMGREFYHYVENDGDINADQRNNQASLQLTDNAQRNIQNFDLINIAASAGNLATNVADLTTAAGVGTSSTPFSQGNVQAACNQVLGGSTDESYEGAQGITNNGNIASGADQDNNNFSVQLKDNAQRDASAGILVNAAGTAVNAGSNIANINAGGDVYLNQYNEQESANWIQSDTPQTVANGGTLYGNQNNNNNSVQLINNALSNVNAVLLVNAASSAVNNAWNIASVNTTGSVTISQVNVQNSVNVVGAGTTAPTCPSCSP